MALQHIQLRPEKLKEVLRPRAVAGKKPALARRLVTQGPKPYAGPTSSFAKEPAFKGGMEYSPITREPLARALAPTGGAPDIQAEAWARREEIVAEEQTRLDKEADALYTAVQDLSPNDQDFVLSKVVSKEKPGGLAAALGVEPGAISPAAVRTDPLMQTMIDKNYIRRDERGGYSWMLPMKEKAVASTTTRIQDNWIYEDITYQDGTTESVLRGPAPKEEVTAGLTSSEQLGWARLQFDVDKAGAIHVAAAMKERGEAPIEGITMIERPGGKKRKATAEDVAAHWTAIKEDADYRRVAAEGIKSVEDAKIKYQYDTEAIKNVQRNIPGMVVDGKWSDELGQVLFDLFFKEE